MLGYWNPRSAKLVPEGEYTLEGVARRGYSIRKGGKTVGTMRRHYTPSSWTVNIPGFTFYTIPGQGAARFGIKETPIKNFKTANDARAAIAEVFHLLQIVVA